MVLIAFHVSSYYLCHRIFIEQEIQTQNQCSTFSYNHAYLFSIAYYVRRESIIYFLKKNIKKYLLANKNQFEHRESNK